jgi:8-oxo-dGTP pyrophosphatase MutT (NUDIX family)
MIDDSWYQRPPGLPEHESAGGVIVRQAGGRLFIALVGEDQLSGYVLPKGHVEPGESAEIAARREIEEEAGISDLRLLAELGVRERQDFRKSSWKKTYYYLYATDQVEGRPTDPHHSYHLHWHPLDEPLPLFWPEQKELVESNRDVIRQRFVGH